MRFVARRLRIVDVPDTGRHRHQSPVPLLGGIGIFVAFWSVIFYLLRFHPILGVERIANPLIAAGVASFTIVLIGIADDVKKLSPRIRLLLTSLPVLWIASVVGGGFNRITNPLGGYFVLGGALATLLVFVWLMGMMYTTKILDGLDGLSTGVVTIGALLIYLLTESPKFFQPNVGLVSLVFTGACLGFLVFNFKPASIFLGESGSLFIGFILGMLAVLGGGKLATALLVMAIPVFDLARVMYRRWRRHQPLFVGDREHLHFQLLDSGMSERSVVLFYYFLAAGAGTLTLILQSYQKIIALFFLAIALAVISWQINARDILHK